MLYEIERLYLTDSSGAPAEERMPSVFREAEDSQAAARAFIAEDGAKPLGLPNCVPGDQCTAVAWREGRLYVLTVWRAPERRRPDRKRS